MKKESREKETEHLKQIEKYNKMVDLKPNVIINYLTVN